MYWSTVDPLLQETLIRLMDAPEFARFRLVGGTALSLQLGHRQSDDIDLFTDATYGTIDFVVIDTFLKSAFPYLDASFSILPAMGRPYIVGKDPENAVKLDVYYTDEFIRPMVVSGNIRMASVEEIIAMKLDVIAGRGRKKDFWDLHELLDKYSISEMMALHLERYPYSHDEEEIFRNFSDFTFADDNLEPNCLRGKYWEIIKLDILDALRPRQ